MLNKINKEWIWSRGRLFDHIQRLTINTLWTLRYIVILLCFRSASDHGMPRIRPAGDRAVYAGQASRADRGRAGARRAHPDAGVSARNEKPSARRDLYGQVRRNH